MEITEGVNICNFKIVVLVTLTLRVSDDGTGVGVPIVGATFYQCDSEGTTYGDAVVSDDVNAVFNYVPYSTEGNAPTVYFKQTESNGEHTFSRNIKNTILSEETFTVEIATEDAATREFNLTDANYSGLPITDGNLTLSSQ